MNETEKNFLIIGLLGAGILLIMLINTGEMDEYRKFFPPIDQDAPATKLSEKLRVDEVNAGPMDFYSAENYCKKMGMTLPTREQAWEMWRASLNCKMAFVLDKDIISDKGTFLKSCHNPDDKCISKASKTDYICNYNENLLFLDEKSYRFGNYWLKDRYDKNGHYSANFINGTTNAYTDTIRLLGVRCVSSKNEN